VPLGLRPRVVRRSSSVHLQSVSHGAWEPASTFSSASAKALD
jgi:hypothetical protein